MEGTAYSIEELIAQLLDAMPTEHIYKLAEEHVDIVKLAASNPTPDDIFVAYSVGGFIAGIKFAMENIESHPDDVETELEEASEKGGKPNEL